MKSPSQVRVPSLAEEVGGGIAFQEPSTKSIGALITGRAALDPARVAVRSRNASGKWTELTWGELDQQRRSVAAGLAQLGVKRGDTVATCSLNSAELLVAELAIVSLGATSAPVFVDFPADVVQHVVADSRARVAVVGTAVQQHKLSGLVEQVVVLDNEPLPGGLAFKTLQGAAELPELSGDEVAFLLYTGGTTGKPKGVEVTHRALLAQQAAIASFWDVSANDVFLSYLPWHHAFGSLFERFMALWHRAVLVLDDSRGRELEKHLANLAEVKPTIYMGVPRVFHALAARTRRDPKAFAAVFKGALRFVFSAAAPVNDATFKWFEENGVPVLEGWGLTEAGPAVTVTRLGTPRTSGIVGWPLPGTTVSLQKADHPHGGEAVVRGVSLMKGYRGGAAPGTSLREGALWTGDLGEWTPHGLRVVGRIDGVFALENVEKVSSGEVEARILAATPLIEHCVVLGPGQAFVTALCWLAQGPARRFCEERNIDLPQTYAELTRVPEIRLAIAEALKASNLLTSVPYERVRRVALVPEPPSAARGEITDTLRMVRGVAGSVHADLVKALQDESTPHRQVLEVSRKGDAFQHA